MQRHRTCSVRNRVRQACKDPVKRVKARISGANLKVGVVGLQAVALEAIDVDERLALPEKQSFHGDEQAQHHPGVKWPRTTGRL